MSAFRDWLKRRIPFLVVLGFLAVLAGFIPIYGTSAEKDPVIMKLSHAKGVFPALKMYAGDHQGRYPATLAELVPDYLVKHHYDWLYQPGLRVDSPVDWIVLSSSNIDKPAKGRQPARRVVVRNDGSAILMAEEEYQRKLAEQKKAMP